MACREVESKSVLYSEAYDRCRILRLFSVHMLNKLKDSYKKDVGYVLMINAIDLLPDR